MLDLLRGRTVAHVTVWILCSSCVPQHGPNGNGVRYLSTTSSSRCADTETGSLTSSVCVNRKEKISVFGSYKENTLHLPRRISRQNDPVLSCLHWLHYKCIVASNFVKNNEAAEWRGPCCQSFSTQVLEDRRLANGRQPCE